MTRGPEGDATAATPSGPGDGASRSRDDAWAVTDSGRGSSDAAPGLPDGGPAVAAVFGDHAGQARRFAELLAGTGVAHGLIGPREVPRLWERHVLNCAVVSDAFPHGARVLDVGSGAGLPGVALAIRRPDLDVHLVEPMLRRTTWLEHAIAELALESCTVHRARAEELHGRLDAPYATARAVARIGKLARWTFPLLSPGGTLVALKGEQAAEELDAERAALTRLGMVDARIRHYGEALLASPTTTVEVVIGVAAGNARKTSRRARARRATGPAS